ncbi:MAG TPA: ATPase, partial [Pseudonocardiaceae bacterium]|nr:ATPase [Pseudonocardiaceae bacterium]
VGAGYEQVVAALGRRPGGHRGTERDRAPRQFIFGDGAGGVERIRVDFSGHHLSHLAAVLDTTPDAQRSEGQADQRDGRRQPAQQALPTAATGELGPAHDVDQSDLEFDEFELEQAHQSQRVHVEIEGGHGEPSRGNAHGDAHGDVRNGDARKKSAARGAA